MKNLAIVVWCLIYSMVYNPSVNIKTWVGEEQVACHLLSVTRYRIPWITSREATCDSRPEGPIGASCMPHFIRETVPYPVNFKPRSGLRLEARRAEMSKSHATLYTWHGTVSRELKAAKRPATRGPKGREEQVACHLLPCPDTVPCPVIRYRAPWWYI